jgi:hypothetical protein
MLREILRNFLKFILLKIKDTYNYYKNKEWEVFNGFGLHIYVGMFGSGKTSSMIRDAYCICKKYKSVRLLSNMKIMNFPKWTKIEELKNYKQIVNCPENTLILIDEISTIFNSREWKKEGIPAPLLSTLLQVRKQNKMLYATAQRFIHVDALMRQITFTVRDCECWRGRWNWVRVYDGYEYEKSNTMNPAEMKYLYSFIQTDKIRGLYDTFELVEKMKKTDYIDEKEILEKQGLVSEIGVVEKRKKLRVK